jgi:potassium efflux system protein
LPALSRLDNWTFGTIAVQSTATATDGKATNGNSVAGPSVISVSLADFILALMVFGTALIAAANIPGLFELILLQNLPLDQALRFAITTVTRYVIFIIGVVWSLRTLGVTWNSVQWLVAAISVGLGFGLQEIFANFISGLIILFERPLRAGDIVTVGDVSGRVVNIRMRATTVEDWDGKELIVPNKEFITGKLLNWTLADTRNRIVVPINIRYGSDVRQAQSIIWQTLTSHPNVMTEPGPSVTVELFGENGIQLIARAFLPTLDCRLPTINELHLAFYENLQAAGFEIPVPHRDVHLHWSSQGTHGAHNPAQDGDDWPLPAGSSARSSGGAYNSSPLSPGRTSTASSLERPSPRQAGEPNRPSRSAPLDLPAGHGTLSGGASDE